MSNTTISPNMNLVIPEVGVDPGPDWANNLNADLGILDQHNHSLGQGVQITPAGININTDLPINSNNLTLVNTVRFNNLLASIPGTSPNLGCLYEAVNNLYFNDGVGNVIQITKAGAVNATSSGISSGTATASFVGSVLVVDADVNTPANVQGASFLFGNNVANSNYLTLEPPSAMASDYTVTLPPTNSTGSLAVLGYDTADNIVVLANGGGNINGNFITPNTITQNLLQAVSIGTTATAGNIALSNGSGSFSTTSASFVTITNLTITITTTGRPVQLMLIPDVLHGNGAVYCTANTEGYFGYQNQTLSTYPCQTLIGNSTSATFYPLTAFSFIDTSVNGLAGTYTYNAVLAVLSGAGSSNCTLAMLYAKEI